MPWGGIIPPTEFLTFIYGTSLLASWLHKKIYTHDTHTHTQQVPLSIVFRSPSATILPSSPTASSRFSLQCRTALLHCRVAYTVPTLGIGDPKYWTRTVKFSFLDLRLIHRKKSADWLWTKWIGCKKIYRVTTPFCAPTFERPTNLPYFNTPSSAQCAINCAPQLSHFPLNSA